MAVDIIALRKKFETPHHLITTSDNKTLFLRIWETKGEALKDSAILLLHGITAYSGPYGMIAEPLAEKGFTVYGLDLRGHGLSDGDRGDSPSMERFIDDLCETLAFVKQRHTKTVIMGHSLGVLSSLIALNNCLEHIDGAVLLSAARKSRPQAYPKMSISQKLKILLSSIIRPSKPVIDYYREGMVGLDDPLFNFKYTFRFMKLVNLVDFKFPEIENLPVFLGIGDNDELFAVEDCQKLFDEIPTEDKIFHVIEGGKHATFPPDCWEPLTGWLDEHFT
ncbi:MAG: alpha/beta hydrolase [Candidatus Thorarchaeota archaeon]